MLNGGSQLSWSFSSLDVIAFGWLPFRLDSLSFQWWTSRQVSHHSLLWCEQPWSRTDASGSRSTASQSPHPKLNSFKRGYQVSKPILISTITSLATKVYILARIKFEKETSQFEKICVCILCICLYSAMSLKTKSTYNRFVESLKHKMSILALTTLGYFTDFSKYSMFSVLKSLQKNTFILLIFFPLKQLSNTCKDIFNCIDIFHLK